MSDADALTPEATETIVEAAAQGASLAECAQAAGVERQTLKTWLSTGEDHQIWGRDTRQAALYRTYHRARVDGIIHQVRPDTDAWGEST